MGKNKDMTALQCAREYGYTDIVAVLEEAEAAASAGSVN